MVNVIYKLSDYELSLRKKEAFEKYNKIIIWGRQHPDRFIAHFLGVDLTDHQKYVILSTWCARSAVWLMSRSSGKSFLSAPYVMARSVLIPSHSTFIMAPTGKQSKTTFLKIKDLALNNMQTAAGLTEVFREEVVRANAKDDGFPMSDGQGRLTLWNGSTVKTLNKVAENILGVRSHLNLFDEAGNIDREFYLRAKPFTAWETSTIHGADINTHCYPTQFPAQTILLSSAENIFTELWDDYRYGAKQMIMGNKDYFVADLNCEFSLHPKKNGIPTSPIITQDTVDAAMAANPYGAMREYYNKFDTVGGQHSIVSKTTIDKNSFPYAPVFGYEDGKKYLIITDPAGRGDNSIILVCELIEDELRGKMLKVVNCRNLNYKTPTGEIVVMARPEQEKTLKSMLVNYNGPGNEYENIQQLLVDDGAGGGGYELVQYCVPEWIDDDGSLHRGIIDLKHPKLKKQMGDHPESVDLVRLINFKKEKLNMYEALTEMVNQNLVMFPKEGKLDGFIDIEKINDDGHTEESRERMDERTLRAVTEIDLLKLETIAMQKEFKDGGKFEFRTIQSEVSRGVHDDRVDCLAMACLYLAKLRAKDRLEKNKTKYEVDEKTFLRGRRKAGAAPKFGGGVNPFSNLGNNPFI